MKRGFTLIETVVTVGIVAAMAAVVIPQVAKQFDAADPTKAAEDLANIRTAIETFSVNVRPQQPGDLEDLVNALNGLNPAELTAKGQQYSAADQANWQGPYLSIASANNPAASTILLTTGFGGTITSRISLFDEAANLFGGDTVTTANVANAEFLAIKIGGLSAAAFNAINEVIDGTSETTVLLRRHSGRFRCPGEDASTGAAADTVCTRGAFYLATPVNQ